MASGTMNARCQKIMRLLLASDDYTKISRIADEVGVSKRSVYYDLSRINEWLLGHGLEEFGVVRGKGIRIPVAMKEQILCQMQGEEGEEDYIFSPSERVKIIICYIIHYNGPVYIEQLADCCQVSRNTIFNDLHIAVNQLKEYNLALTYENKRGYRIEGDLIQVRALYFLYFNSLMPLFNSGVLPFVSRDEIKTYLGRLKEIEKELGTEYVDGILLSLAALMPLMEADGEKPVFGNLKKGGVERTREYALVKKHFGELDEQEQIYLCLHLLGSRVAVAENPIIEDPENMEVYEITKALVAEFEKVACVVFEDREELERALFIHISTSLYRYQYGIQIGNPMSDDVMREYPNLFDITKVVSRYLAQLVGLPIPDSEVAYLALHFGAHLKIARHQDEQLRILIVCVNGVATGNMLRREIHRLLPDARIVDVVAAVDVINIQNICDLVISTVQIQSIVPVLVVHPILTDYDRKMILGNHLITRWTHRSEGNQVLDVAAKYMDPEQFQAFKQELTQSKGGSSDPFSGDAPKTAGLVDYLKMDRVTLTQDAFRWTEAVRFAGKTLIECGSIDRKYVDNIISQLRFYGPYMFVAKGLLLAHAKPEDGANQLDVAMTVFKKPVRFSEFYEAKIIITLSMKDQEQHLGILKDIMTVFADEEKDMASKIWALPDAAAVIKFLDQYIQDHQE